MADWFYGIGGDKHGPIPLAKLEQLVTTNQIGPGTLVWSEGMPAWVPVASLPFLQPPKRPADDGGALNLLIPMAPQSGLAIAAGYCGLLGFMIFTAPVGIILGVAALKDLKAHPEKRGAGRAWTGIIGGAFFTLLYAYLFLK